MAHVTDRRLAKITPILERYREKLRSHRSFSARQLEHEIRDELNFGYTSIKTFVPELCKYAEHLHVAVYCMQHMNTPGPIAQHKLAIARVLGIRSYNSNDREQAEHSFWNAFYNGDA